MCDTASGISTNAHQCLPCLSVLHWWVFDPLLAPILQKREDVSQVCTGAQASQPKLGVWSLPALAGSVQVPSSYVMSAPIVYPPLG